MSDGPGPGRDLGGPLLGLLAGAGVGAAVWWLLVPTPPVEQRGGLVVAPGAPELYATQDGVFAGVAMVLGLATGAALLLRPGRARPIRAATTVVASGVASLLMWQLGGLLAQTGPSGTAPLTVHATGVLGLWPATAATVLFVGYLWADLAGQRAG